MSLTTSTLLSTLSMVGLLNTPKNAHFAGSMSTDFTPRLHFWWDETPLWRSSVLLPIHRHWTWWYGDADAQETLRILGSHFRTSQNWCRSNPCHSLAHAKRYRISLQCSRHLCYHLHGRARDARQNQHCVAPLPNGETPYCHWCTWRRLARFPSWSTRSRPLCPFFCSCK